jgi:hypothetical protein
MKKSLIFLIVMLLAGKLYSQQPVSKKEQAVHQTIIKLFDALSNRDSISLKTNSTADITLYEYGQVWNIDTLILKAITQNQSADFKRTNTFEFINTATDKTTAWVAYRLQSVILKDGKQSTAQWLETVVLSKERKRWKVKHLHSTLIKRT